MSRDTLLDDIVWDDLDIEEVKSNSFKDFHAKGLDYVCLHRDAGLTLKAYFFADGMDSQRVGEVVNPHDHRYDFVTQCFSGEIENQLYRISGRDDWTRGDYAEYGVFEWRTPLNGGNGFTYIGEQDLTITRLKRYTPGQSYYMAHDKYHTIRVAAPETCIVLAQYEDKVPLNEPTVTFTTTVEPPSLDGLYTTFTSDELVKRIDWLKTMQERL